MAQTNINVRVEDTVKDSFDKFCTELGMNMSTAINLFIRTTLREKRIPFELTTDPFYSEKNIRRLKKSIAQIEETGGTIHEVIDDDEKMV
ncbi:MAG: type II toxin-antitoxin system RelB/DinJ family antitoxin [Clostridia bacterium]|nr:type II toxin-antitoxin system RelB/DinJ family antitoxin [Clostridia bacterium]